MMEKNTQVSMQVILILALLCALLVIVPIALSVGDLIPGTDMQGNNEQHEDVPEPIIDDFNEELSDQFEHPKNNEGISLKVLAEESEYQKISATSFPIGFELLDAGQVLHIWNVNDDYYFDTDSGIQLTNHYSEYWSRNLFCAGYKTTDWNYQCTDSLPFNWSLYKDSFEINITGYKDVTIGTKTVRFGLRYHLGVNDLNLSVIPFIIGLEGNVTSELGFLWRITNIQISNTTANDYLYINETTFFLNQSFEYNYTALPETKIFLGDTSTGENLWVSWNENLNYFVNVNNQNENLLIRFTGLNEEETKTTRLNWMDSLCSWSCYLDAPPSDPNISRGQTFSQTGHVGYAGSCLTRGTIEAQHSNGSYIKTTSSTVNLSTSSMNPDYIFGSETASFTISGESEGVYAVRNKCLFNNEGPKYSGGQTVTVLDPGFESCDSYTTVSSNMTLSANSTGCYNITSNDVTFDCAGYSIIGKQQKYDYAFVADGVGNLVIKNCDVWNFPQTLELVGSSNIVFINNSVRNMSVNDPDNATIRTIKLVNTENVSVQDSMIRDAYSNNTATSECSDAVHAAIAAYDSGSLHVTGSIIEYYEGEDVYSDEFGCGLRRDYGSSFFLENVSDSYVESCSLNVFGDEVLDIDGTSVQYNRFQINNSIINGSKFYVRGTNVVISGNNFTNAPTHTVYVYSSSYDNVTIQGNRFLGGTGSGYYIGINDNADNVLIDGNYLDGHGEIEGVNIKADYAVVQNNILNNTESSDIDGAAISAMCSHCVFNNNSIFNANCSGSRGAGLYLGYGEVNISVNKLLIDSQKDGYGLKFMLLNNINVTSVTITNSQGSDADVYNWNSDEIYLIDSYFNKSSFFFNSDGYDMHVAYSVTANVTDTSYSPISVANVTVCNSSSDLIGEDLTDANGLASFIVTEFSIRDDTNITYVEGCSGSGSSIYCNTPHIISASKDGEYNSENVTVNETLMVYLVLDLIVGESSGRDAILEGVLNALTSGYTSYEDQRIYTVNITNSHRNGKFDIVSIKNNQTWAFNYVSTGESATNMLGIPNTVNVWENQSLSYSQIVYQVETFINTALE